MVIESEAIVVRFQPFTPENLFNRIDSDFQRTKKYRASCFVGIPLRHESSEMTVQKILAAAELGGIRKANNLKYIYCIRAEILLNAGFAILKDGDEGEIEAHFSIDFGETLLEADCQKMLDCFQGKGRWI